MRSKIRYYLFLLIAGYCIGGFLAVKDRIFGPDPSGTEEKVTEDTLKTEKLQEDTIRVEQPDPKEEKKAPAPQEVKPLPPKKPKPLSPSPPLLACSSKEFELEHSINLIADWLENQKILYNSRSLSDCSGIFLRVCQTLASSCPEEEFPTPKEARDGRKLAKWYHDRGRLTLIQDAKSSSKLIKPGAVMFFGRRNRTYEPVSLKKITASDGIEHIGIVTAVEKNAEGVITNYTLFHGRSSGKFASRTTHHHLNPSRDDIPAYGNWNQQWVAVASII